MIDTEARCPYCGKRLYLHRSTEMPIDGVVKCHVLPEYVHTDNAAYYESVSKSPPEE